MKSLLERAKPELRQVIDDHKKSYPNVVESLERCLNKNHFVIDIPFEFILEIKSILSSYKMDCQDHQIWNYFIKNEE